MRFTLIAFITSVAALVGAVPQPRQTCPEATQYGTLIVSPTSVSAGDVSQISWSWDEPQLNTMQYQTLTVNADFSCAINTFGHIPAYTDYYIEVPQNNNGHEPPILLARRTLASGSTSDSFTVQVYSFRAVWIELLLIFSRFLTRTTSPEPVMW